MPLVNFNPYFRPDQPVLLELALLGDLNLDHQDTPAALESGGGGDQQDVTPVTDSDAANALPIDADTPAPLPLAPAVAAEPEPALMCNFGDNCKKVFTTERRRELHIEKIHHGPKKYTCVECGHKERDKKGMRNHMRRTHKKALKCDLCSKTFKDRYRLNQHKDMDHTLLPVTCKGDNCQDKTFTSKRELENHMKTCTKKKPEPKVANSSNSDQANMDSNSNGDDDNAVEKSSEEKDLDESSEVSLPILASY